MTESALWKELNRIMKEHWEASRHEDKLSKGVPDVSYSLNNSCSGWIELKTDFRIKDGIITFPRLEASQRIWLYRRNRLCGNCFVLAANEEEWVFIPAHKLLTKKIHIGAYIEKKTENIDWKWIYWKLGGNRHDC